MKRLVLLLCTLFTLTFSQSDCRVVAYHYLYPTNTTDIDYSKVTHLIGSFVNSDTEGNLFFQSYNKPENIITALKEGKAKGAVPMIAVGTTKDTWEMTKSKTARTNFIQNLLAFCDTNGIVGIDLDLEGVAEEFNWGNPGTFFPEPYELLAVELREAMPDEMLLTSAVGSHSRNGAQWTDGFLAQLDFINVMIYDRALSWESSPIMNHSTWEAHAEAAEYWHEDRKLPREKISLGVPFYARGWDRDNNRIYREDPGWDVTTWDYNSFADRFSVASDQDTFDIAADDSIKHKRAEGVTGRATFFFNSPKLIARKTQWSIDSAYGGVMLWHIGADVSTAQGNSLLNAIDSVKMGNTALVGFSTVEISGIKLHKDRENIQLQLEAGHFEVSLVSLLGRELYATEVTLGVAGSLLIPQRGIASGIYFLKVRDHMTNQSKQLTVYLP